MNTPSLSAQVLLGLLTHPSLNHKDLQYLSRYLGDDPWQWRHKLDDCQHIRGELKSLLVRLLPESHDDIRVIFTLLKTHLSDLEKYEVGVLCRGDEAFPAALKRLPDAPVLLFYRGDPSVMALPQIAIVGSRQASIQGQRTAKEFAQQFAHGGFVITSGLARGIDAAAHRGCLASGGKTVAVLARGLDDIYPLRHRGLGREIIASGGVLLSEYMLGTPALPHQFPVRNRLITGLSQALLVVEAARQSGSVISAKCALEQGVEVFAVPGSIYSPQSEGCLDLLRDGAMLATSPSDVVAGVQFDLFEEHDDKANLTPQAQRVLSCLSSDPVGVDQIVAQTQWPVARVMACLTECEVAGVASMVANRFMRR